MNLTNLEFHELANEFPLLTKDETQELAEDIKANGLVEEITLFEGKILDGRNRYNACKIAGYDLNQDDIIFFEERHPEEDPVAYVISMNIKRRHLGVGQRAAIGNRLVELMKAEDGKAKEKMKKAADAVKVAASAVEQAGFVKKHDPEGFKDLQKGTKTLHKAVKQAAKEAAKKATGHEIDQAWERVQTVCGKPFAAAIKEDQVDALSTPKHIIAFSELADDKMKAIVPVLKLGWKLARAMSFLDKEITPATTFAQAIDLFVFKGSKKFDFEMEGVKFTLSKGAPKGNGDKKEE